MKVSSEPFENAVRWWINGDHPDDGFEVLADASGAVFRTEGKLVRYFRHPNIDGGIHCKHCGNVMHLHGWIDPASFREIPADGLLVCPGSWVAKRPGLIRNHTTVQEEGRRTEDQS